MKRLSMGLMAAFSALWLGACGQGEGVDDVGSQPQSPGEGEVATEPPPSEFGGENFVIWLDREDYGEAIIAALNNHFPDTNFSWVLFEQVDTLTALALDGPGGLGADVLFFPHDDIHQAIAEQLVLPLGPDLSAMIQGRFHEAAVETVYDEVTGFHFGIPLSTESVAMFYNRTILEAHGFEPASSFEELIQQVEEMNDPARNIFHLRINPGNPYDSHWALTAHGFQLFGPQHKDPDQVNFNTPETVAGLAWLRDLRQQVLDVPAADLNDGFAAFAEGEAAYFITGPWHIAEAANGDFELGIMKIPTINGVQPLTFSGNIIAAGSSFTSYPALTRAVLDFLSSDEGLQILYDVRGSIPALNDASVITGLLENPLHLGILDQAAYSHSMPIIPEMSHFWEVSGGMYSSVWDGVMTPEEAVAHAELEYDSLRALAGQ